MILVTGATGHLGSQVIEHLQKHIPASSIAALIRDENKAQELKTQGVQLRVADYHDTTALGKAMEGVDKVLLISSSDFNDRLQQHKNVVDAAKNAGVKHIAYTGVSMKNQDSSVLKDFMGDHFDTDEYIRQSGVPYTLLQHNLYADVLPMFLGGSVLENGIYFPAGNGKVPFALRSEMAEAAANVLLSDEHAGKTYRINSTESYDFNTIAQTLSERSGKTVNYIDAEVGEFEAALKGAGLPEMIIGMTVGFATAMKDGDFDTVSSDLETLLGRKPAGVQEAMNALFLNN